MMRPDYFERLDRYERLVADHRRLHEAMMAVEQTNPLWQKARMALGRAMIRTGAWIANEPTERCYPAHRWN